MLRIDGLRKAFGEVQALDGVSLTVRPGEVFGFLGANGAGKTTTMRIVLGFLRADAGTVTWLDRDATAWPRRVWGYMPEERSPGSPGSGSRNSPIGRPTASRRATSRRSSTSRPSSTTLTCC
jgi:ABC-type multidrug transport system ATPase subunit